MSTFYVSRYDVDMPGVYCASIHLPMTQLNLCIPFPFILLYTSTAMHDAYCEAKSYRIILEFMNGGDLLDIIEAENSLDEVTARSVCYSLMSAITHLHSHSIAHR